MGAFVYNNHDAELLFRARIPYWFIYPTQRLMQVRIDRLEDLLEPANYQETPSSDVPIIYEGPANLSSIYNAVMYHTQLQSHVPNPFIPAS